MPHRRGRGRGQEAKKDIVRAAGFHNRLAARRWLHEQGSFADVFAQERHKRDGEDSEPDVSV